MNGESLILVGMPGAGKSTIGLLLAKELALGFVDTDILIQVREGKALDEILHSNDYLTLRRIEEDVLLGNDFSEQVVATGGSAIYSEKGMEHLRRYGRIVFLDVPLEVVRGRLHNFATRGIASEPGQSLEDVYEERVPLYKRWADITVPCGERSQDEVVAEIIYAEGDVYAEMDA